MWNDKFRKSRVLLNKLITMVTPDTPGIQKYFLCSMTNKVNENF